MGYPAVIMPLFRAAQTTDALRLVITCFVHPIVHEFVAMTYRGASCVQHATLPRASNHVSLFAANQPVYSFSILRC